MSELSDRLVKAAKCSADDLRWVPMSDVEADVATRDTVAAVLRELEAEATRRGGDGVYWPFPGDLGTLIDEIEERRGAQ